MDIHTVMKRFCCQRSLRYGILVCIALFVILKYTRKGKIYIVYESDIQDFGMKEEKNMSYNTKSKSDTKNGVHSNTYSDNNNEVLNLARKVSSYNKTVLVSVVNDAYLPFAYSWLCNTKAMGIHKSVLVITMDNESKIKLNRDWPEVSVFHLQLDIPKGDQEYSHVGYVKIMIRRTEIILSLLQANIDLLLLEFDYVWFSNPIPGLQKRSGVDMLVNPVSNTGGTVFNGGLLYLFATDRTKTLWTKLTEMMWKLEREIKEKPNNKAISEGQNDQTFLSKLIRERYANITTQLLTLDVYADGKWYSMSNAQRQKLHPIVISNNWIIGNKNKINRAKEWNHWFLRPDNTCDMDTVKKIVYSEV
ncbi:uncharacterized protein LOC123544411 isoform X1 [Mercenaria mercenaria]|uniref:uncharacterized protein LOC123544411 isoform X1 n=1 Tax=Mercenaria mercenaria TaxID=6596 RepID=UPI00234FA1A1|nr:uncharacterized protein LOC123544411 isoform X1 [Mercenaria mercenaria]